MRSRRFARAGKQTIESPERQQDVHYRGSPPEGIHRALDSAPGGYEGADDIADHATDQDAAYCGPILEVPRKPHYHAKP